MVSQTFAYLAYEWDVGMLELAAAGRRPNAVIDVAAWTRYLGPDPAMEPGASHQLGGVVEVDWDRVDKLSVATLGNPLLVVTFPCASQRRDACLIVDGWHRLALARRINRLNLHAHVLDVHDSFHALTHDCTSTVAGAISDAS